MVNQDDRRTVFNLFAEIIDETTHLFQTEMRLIRAEINEKLGRIANSGAMIGAGAVAVIAAIFLLLQAIVRWLAIAGLPDQWGYLLVGIVVGAIGAALLAKGAKDVRATNLMPDRTLHQLRADLETVKEHVT